MSHRFSQITTIVLAVVAGIAMALAAWAGWGFHQSRHPGGNRGRGYSSPTPRVAASQPTGNLFDLASAGAPVLNRDPAGPPTPPGARRIRTVQIRPGQEIGHYLFIGPRDVLESAYAKELTRLGWQSLGRTGSGGLLFRLDQQLCLVNYEARPGGQEAEVTVVVDRLDQR